MTPMDLTPRVERLEARCRVLSFAAAAAGVAALLAGTAAFRAPQDREVIGADEVVLRDDVGRPRAVLGVEDGTVGLRLTDPGGNVRARLAVDPAGAPRFDLLDDLGRVRSSLQLDAEGAVALRTYPESGEGGAWIGVNEGGNPVCALEVPGEEPSRVLLGASAQRSGLTILERGEVSFRAP